MADRLQKILAHAGMASRRTAEQMIAAGRVSINGAVVFKMGTTADPLHDEILVDGQPLPKVGKATYILLNKPRNVVSTVNDPEKRRTVVDLVRPRIQERVYPVGRLDFASEGLLILTNDGRFTRYMTSGRHVPKVYLVKVSGIPEPESIRRLQRGIRVGTIRYASCKIKMSKAAPNPWYEVTLMQGKNRQIRQMFQAIGHQVVKLKRIRIGFLEDHRLHPGSWRLMKASEIQRFYDQYWSTSDSDGLAKGEKKGRMQKVERTRDRKSARRLS